MAYYVNVADWVPEQVAEWLRGLDDVLQYYIQHFLVKGVGGHRLLSLTIDDLPSLHVEKLGHQELLMGAIDLLRDFHYNLDRENLQYIAMQLGCKARNLHSELRVSRALYQNGHESKTEQVTTSTLSAVADIIDCVKDLIFWLNRPPFEGTETYALIKSSLLKLSLELVTIAQRDLFAEQPVQVIRDGCLQLAKLSDSIVQDFSDPLVVQPASLDVATVKKKPEDDLILANCPSGSGNPDTLETWVQGMRIQTSFKGVHVINGVKIQSPAHQCGKIEEGDEIVQVNYQTVVGWQQKKLRTAMLENSTKIILTLKKRPRHSNNFGQIYVKPYRLPSKKREAYNFRWHLECQPQGQGFTPTRVDPLTIPVVEIGQPPTVEVAITELPPSGESDNDSDDDTFLPNGQEDGNGSLGGESNDGTPGAAPGAASPTSVRLYMPKPRFSIQRRATVTGASPTSSRPPVNIEQFLKEIKREQWTRTPEAQDILQRPHSSAGTYKNTSGMDNAKRNQVDINANGVSETDILRPKEFAMESLRPATCIGTRTTVEVRADSSVRRHFEGAPVPSKQSLLSSAADVEEKIPESGESSSSQPPSRKVSQDRPKLDKSQSTPAYDTVEKDASIFEEKLNDIKSRKKSRIEEAVIEEEPTSPTNDPGPSHKPALPPRNYRPQRISAGSPGSTADALEAMLPAAVAAAPDASLACVASPNASHSHTSVSDEATVESSEASPTSRIDSQGETLSPHDLGLRPHEVRDLIRRGLWQWHAADGHKGLPALTRVTRLDSNFEPVPGSTVPRIAPSLLVYSTLPRQEEEVHVALPPLKSTSASSSSNSETLTRTGTPVQQPGGRRVACSDLGEGDCQGWLHRRRQARGFLSGPRWTRRWFVLKKHTLYGFRDPEDQKAESLVYLPGFSAAMAPEVKSKKFAFKVFNPGTAFYFACETKEELNKWLNDVSQSATAAYNSTESTSRDSSTSKGSVYYSETEDESLDEGEGSRTGSLGRRKGVSILQKSPFSSATVGRVKKSSESSPAPSPPPTQKSPIVASLDRKYLRFLRVGQEKQPVPTPQYRSYRKPPSLSSLISPPPVHQEETARFYVNAKPPPRPPSKSKSPSPGRIPSALPETNLGYSTQPHPTPRKSLARTQAVTTSSDAATESQSAVRKSVSTSRLAPAPRRSSDSSSTPSYENLLPQRRSVSRRHSIELSSVKKTSPASKPQSPASQSAVFSKSGSEPPLVNESGYARIQPRRSSGEVPVKKPLTPVRLDSTGRRPSLSSSRRSSGDAGSSVKSGGTSSLPRSPLSPSAKDVFDFQQMESPREGPPDRLWISSLRNNPPPVAPKPRGLSPRSPDAPAVNPRLKSAACYQPMNFPLSPTSQKDDGKMKLAFEMNLDNTISPHGGSGSSKSTPESASKNIFKIFASPKFARKSPAPPPDASPLTTPKTPPAKTLLGSPRLHRAIFGSGRDKRKKADPPQRSIAEEPLDFHVSNNGVKDKNSSTASVELQQQSNRPMNRPPPLISPLTPSTSSSFYEESDSCPGTPRTPLKPAMGVSMIGKQRRTPITNESFPFSPTLSHSPSLPLRTPPTFPSHFTYTVPVKTSPPPSYPLTVATDPGTGELEYPPVFEPGSYSLADKKTGNQSLATAGQQNQSNLKDSPNLGRPAHPIPAPRTKFLINPAAAVQHVVQADVERTTAEESNA